MRAARGLLALAALGVAANAFGQTPKPVPVVVIDARGFTVGLGQDEITASGLGITVSQLPTRGLGGVAAVHVFPIRRPGFAIGVVGEVLIGRGRRRTTDTNGEVLSVVERRIQGLSGGISLNFGNRNGWSYLSGGMGPVLFETFLGDSPPSPAPARDITLNFGGGARWFNTPHLAFCFDVRFYETRPANPTFTSPGRERRRLLVMSAGISVR